MQSKLALRPVALSAQFVGRLIRQIHEKQVAIAFGDIVTARHFTANPDASRAGE